MLRIGHSRLSFLFPTARANSFAAFTFLLLVGDLVSAESQPGNPLNIDRDPAPPPDQGPPLSRGASRDKSLLGAQIGAIVGSYILFIIVLGTFLALVGRRLRADALTARGSADIEMAKTAFQRTFDPSPISPSPNPSSASPEGKSAAPNFSWPSPTKQNFSGFDERVLQEDKEKRERDMERLYAAVMEHEASGGASRSGSRVNSVAESKRYQQHKQPAPLSISKGNGDVAEQTPRLKSPSLFRALRSPRQKSSPEKTDRSRPPSLTSTSSSSRRKGSGVRGLTISGPVPTPTFSFHSTGAASDEEPLTPRYPPPTPPPKPGPSSRTTHSTLTTPPRPTTAGSSTLPSPPLSTTSSPSRRGGLSTTRQAALPNLTIPPTSRTPPRIITTLSTGSTSTAAPPQPRFTSTNYSPTPSSPASPTSVSSLPLRSLNNALATAAASGMGTLHPSAHTTKLTILERTSPSPAAMAGAPLRTGASMLSPGAVPYSPYMPFTPVTPITPGLVSRKDRKAREKREGRRARLVTELVRDEEELWDGGY
ncbi:MAG: hypothetical protein M1816_001717 [Peltula sp. TS41687]|nr:MAG: hypothetical protein M1816_001717 [Peltula sp. TS41687]